MIHLTQSQLTISRIVNAMSQRPETLYATLEHGGVGTDSHRTTKTISVPFAAFIHPQLRPNHG